MSFCVYSFYGALDSESNMTIDDVIDYQNFAGFVLKKDKKMFLIMQLIMSGEENQAEISRLVGIKPQNLYKYLNKINRMYRKFEKGHYALTGS